MDTKTDSLCGIIDSIHRERVRYFPRQLINADDMMAEQEYFREKMRRHNRFLHGWGVVCGCEVKPNPDKDHPWQVTVCPGYIITPQGDEILISKAVDFDLAEDRLKSEDPCAHWSPCPPTGVRRSVEESQTVYLAACYTECNTKPVRVHPVGCACEEVACEYSRIRDSFELVRLLDLPESHKLDVKTWDKEWVGKVDDWLNHDATNLLPNCPETSDDNCVVLATIILPKEGETVTIDNVDNNDVKRVIYSVHSLIQILKVVRDRDLT